MKVGDKLLCKCNYEYMNRYLFIVDNSYEILHIDDGCYYILDEDNDMHDIISFFHYDVIKIFYLPEELRLKKLESL